MPVHDETASCVNLAKALLRDMDRTSVNMSIRSATFAMLLEKLIDLGTPDVQTMQAVAVKTVAERLKAVNGG